MPKRYSTFTLFQGGFERDERTQFKFLVQWRDSNCHTYPLLISFSGGQEEPEDNHDPIRTAYRESIVEEFDFKNLFSIRAISEVATLDHPVATGTDLVITRCAHPVPWPAKIAEGAGAAFYTLGELSWFATMNLVTPATQLTLEWLYDNKPAWIPPQSFAALRK